MPKLIAIVALLPLIACLICGCASHSASGSGGSSHSSGGSSGAGVAPANSGESVEERPYDESVPEWVSIYPATLGPDSTLIVTVGFDVWTTGFAQWSVMYSVVRADNGSAATKDDVLYSADTDDSKQPDLSPGEISRTFPLRGMSFLVKSKDTLAYDYVVTMTVKRKGSTTAGKTVSFLVHR